MLLALTGVGDGSGQRHKRRRAVDEDDLAESVARRTVRGAPPVVVDPDVQHGLGRERGGKVVVSHAVLELSGPNVGEESVLGVVAACYAVQDVCDPGLCSEGLVYLRRPSALSSSPQDAGRRWGGIVSGSQFGTHLLGISHVERHGVDLLARVETLAKDLVPSLFQRAASSSEQGDVGALEAWLAGKGKHAVPEAKPLAASRMAMAFPSPPEPPVTKTVCRVVSVIRTKLKQSISYFAM